MIYTNFSKLKFKFGIDLAGDNVVWIAGSGRSGTSWLANSINHKNDFRYIFEPLNPNFLEQNQSDIDWFPHVQQKHGLLESIVLGKISNAWVNSRNRNFFARKRLVKSIRSNLMIPWINRNFPNVKVVIINRNPLAVAASRKALANRGKGNWIWEPSLEVLLVQNSLKQLLSLDELNKLNDQVGGGIVRETVAEWIISNLLSLKQCDPDHSYRLHYESLVRQDIQVVSGLCNYLGTEDSSGLVKSLSVRSETDRNFSQETGCTSPLERWRTELDENEISWAMEFLESFNLNLIYDSDLEPVI